MRIIRQTLHQVTVCLQRLDKFLFLSALALIMQANVISDTAETPTEYGNLLLRMYWAEQSSFVNRVFDIFTVIKLEKNCKEQLFPYSDVSIRGRRDGRQQGYNKNLWMILCG